MNRFVTITLERSKAERLKQFIEGLTMDQLTYLGVSSTEAKVLYETMILLRTKLNAEPEEEGGNSA